MKLPGLLAVVFLLSLVPAGHAQVVRGAPHQDVPEFIGWVEDELIVVLNERARRDVVVTVDLQGNPRAARCPSTRGCAATAS